MAELNELLESLGDWSHAGSDRSSTASQRAARGADALLLSIERTAMACEFEVLLNRGQYPHGVEKAGVALDAVARLESLLSVYLPTSDFSTINRFASQRPIPVSTNTLELIRAAQAIHDMTDGAFDITAGSLSEVWGFSRRHGRVPSPQEIDHALAASGSQHVVIDELNRVLYSKPGININPGGIGKGYALDIAARILVQAGTYDFMLHGGRSSIVAVGNRQSHDVEQGWIVALKHPWRFEEVLGTIRLHNAALGTSGSGKQFFHFEGKRYSHIIDPRTGRPADGMMSSTVICNSGTAADALATAMFVLGPEKSAEFCEAHPEIGAILVYQDSKSGSMQIAKHNVQPDHWQPRK